MDALTAINTRNTPQSEQADPSQVRNSAGGYTFQLSDDARVHRFLTLGTEGGTYYTTECDLTRDNAQTVLRNATERGTWLVKRIVEISTSGRAPRQNPAIFALAACAGLADNAGRTAALAALPAVCRTGTHLFLFAGYVEQFRGWGRGLRQGVANWYTDRDVDQLAYQVVKYRNRAGWTHRDLLRLAHPKTDESARKMLFDWVCGRGPSDGSVPTLIGAFELAQNINSVRGWVSLVTDYPLSWEMLPDAALTKPDVWHAMIARGMPQTALIRQLPRLTRLGVLDNRETLGIVTARLTNPELLRSQRVHPVSVLIALRTYADGHSVMGSGTWTPNRQVIDALDTAFYTAFGTVEPAGKRTLIALDVSGSMTNSVSGLPISCREASAALALVTMASEPDCDVVGFTRGEFQGIYGRTTNGLTELPISPRQRLDDAIRAVSSLPFGGTDCALPMMWAEQAKRLYDTVVVITDNETWAGPVHVHQALRSYRERSGLDTRMVVVGMTATNFSIADPQDPGSLDVAGFDSAVPTLISDFSRRSI